MPKRILEAATPEERGKIRRGMGTLRQLTVQPSTRKRYDKALQEFFTFLRHEGLDLPTNKQKVDPLVCDYLEELWATGKGRGLVIPWPGCKTASLACAGLCREPGGSCGRGRQMRSLLVRHRCLSI